MTCLSCLSAEKPQGLSLFSNQKMAIFGVKIEIFQFLFLDPCIHSKMADFLFTQFSQLISQFAEKIAAEILESQFLSFTPGWEIFRTWIFHPIFDVE